MVKYCKNCGSKLEDDSVFCNECGTKFGESSKNNFNSFDNPFTRYNVDMMDGENVIRSSQIHIGCLYIPAIVMGFGFLFGLFSAIIIAWNSYYVSPLIFLMPFVQPLFILGLIWLIIRYIGYKNNDLILTNKRVFGKCGLIFTTQMQSPLNKIDSVSVSQGIFAKLIGYGTVEVYTTSSRFKFRFIRESHSFYNDIFNQLEISEKVKRVENANVIVDAFSEKLND